MSSLVDVTGPAADAVEPPDIRLGVVRGVSYGLWGKPDEFVPQARALGAGLVRSYVYWGQVEPRPGQYEWDVVDALLDQLDGHPATSQETGQEAGVEAWVTVCSSSPWATRQPTDFLPPSPAHDLATYGEFVRRLVAHCAGRVRYWQCDNEPSNTGLLWAGTAEEYVAQLDTMYRAVKQADPVAVVVLGGCGYDVLSSDEGSEPRRFFEHLVSAGRDAFDAFDVHLYGDVRQIGSYLATARQFMRAQGYLRPILVGEHAGPVLFEFPELEATLQQIMASAFADAPASHGTAELAERMQDSPERRALRVLYEHSAELPPTLRMFMAGCPPELEARRHRINSRQVVMRTLLALSEGVRRTAYWNLAPEVPGAGDDPYQMMHLLFGKLPLLDYEDGSLRHRYPAAEAFAMLAGHLDGAERVTRVADPDQPTVAAFHVERAGRGPLLVLWDERDQFDGEDEPPITVRWPWTARDAVAVDALGSDVGVEAGEGTVRLPLSVTPVFVTSRE